MDNNGKITLDAHSLDFEMTPESEKELIEMLEGQWSKSAPNKTAEKMNLRKIDTIFSLSTDYDELCAATDALDIYALAEEQKRLFILPVALGDTLYGFDAEIQRVYKLKISEIDFTTDGVYLKSCEYGPTVNLANLGKTLFKTKDEAIKKLVEALNDEKTENNA